MKRIALLLVGLLVVGCKPEATQTMVIPNTTAVSKSDEVEIVLVGTFKDKLAYDNIRGIYRIKDKVNGGEYIGISGVGIAEVSKHRTGKVWNEDER